MLIGIKSGCLYAQGDPIPDGEEVMPTIDAEPLFPQIARSRASAHERTKDGRFDMSDLSPEHTWRIGRDYLAHCLRYGWPLNVIAKMHGAGSRILEMGCGRDLPILRTTLSDHSAVTHYKMRLYVGADLNVVKYRPLLQGMEILLLDQTDITSPEGNAKVPACPFDFVISFEVLEHMDKPDGERFLDAMFNFARRKSKQEGSPGHILLSTPVNGGFIAKNHIYEWHAGELEAALLKRGGVIKEKLGMFSNITDLAKVLTPEEVTVWNSMTKFHSPHTLSVFFSVNHPEVARNIAWLVEVA